MSTVTLSAVPSTGRVTSQAPAAGNHSAISQNVSANRQQRQVAKVT